MSEPIWFTDRMWTKSFRLITGLGLLLSTGCTLTSYQSASGERFHRVAIGSSTSVGELTVDAGTNGVRSLKLKSYASDQTQTAAAVTEAAVKAALAK